MKNVKNSNCPFDNEMCEDSDKKIRIVIVEDHRLFREGLRSILKDEKNIEIAGEAVNGFQAIDMVADLNPDVVLLDIAMPALNGIQAIPLIIQKSAETKIHLGNDLIPNHPPFQPDQPIRWNQLSR